MVHEEDADIVNIQSGELLQLQRESSQCVVLCCVVLCCVVWLQEEGFPFPRWHSD